MAYEGRPGISPALATLIATGRITPAHAVLDVGCGTGTDALLLARWGFRRVVGVDPDAAEIGIARSRATRARLAGRVRFHAVSAERLSEVFDPRTFDVALHTLVANNLERGRDRHFREVASVLKPDGLLLVHERVRRDSENVPPGGFRPLRALARHFELTKGISTHLAEHAAPGYARVQLWIGRPK